MVPKSLHKIGAMILKLDTRYAYILSKYERDMGFMALNFNSLKNAQLFHAMEEPLRKSIK